MEWICVSVNSFSPLQKPQLNEKLRCFDCRVQQQLQQVFRDFNATCIDLRIGDNCLKMTGYIAIYKISFSITIFFVTMFFITLGVTTSKGIRACIHNGFWFIKVREEAMILIPILDMKISYKYHFFLSSSLSLCLLLWQRLSSLSLI